MCYTSNSRLLWWSYEDLSGTIGIDNILPSTRWSQKKLRKSAIADTQQWKATGSGYNLSVPPNEEESLLLFSHRRTETFNCTAKVSIMSLLHLRKETYEKTKYFNL